MTTETNKSDGAERIMRERLRQMSKDEEGEDFSAARDDAYIGEQLIYAATAYLHADDIPFVKIYWPWAWGSFKPVSKIRNLERAGALIAAEIDRLLRAEAAQKAEAEK